MGVHDLTVIEQNIADLYQQVNCIKNGDCCGGVGTDISIYTDNGTFGSGRQGTLTDTLEILHANSKILHTFDDSGDTWFIQSSDGGLAVGKDKSESVDARLHLKGVGNTIATTLAKFDSLDNSNRYVLYDSGETRLSANGVEGIAHRISSSGEAWLGLQIINNSTLTTTVTYGLLVNVGNPNSDYLVCTNSEMSSNNANPVNIGAFGGITGRVQDGYFDDASITYNAGVKGSVGLDTTKDVLIGSYNSAGGVTNATHDGKTLIGTYGEAQTTNLGALIAVGGMFRSYSITGITNSKHIALLIPSTENIGNVVIGADNSSANSSMVELTGDLEFMNALNGIILLRPDGGRRRITIDNTDTLQINVA